MSISAVAHSFPLAPEFHELEFKPDRWRWAAPTITAIAIGVIFIPNFSIGLAVGAVDFIIIVTGIVFLEEVSIINKAEKVLLDEEDLLGTSLFVPIAEEGIYRGGIQPFLTHIVQTLVPAANASFLGTRLNVATTVSIVITSSTLWSSTFE